MTRRPRVLVTDSMRGIAPEAGVDLLAPLRAQSDCRVWSARARPSKSELLREARECEGLLCLLTDAVDAELIAACAELRVISSCSVGVDHIDVAAATARGIRIGHTPGVLSETTADLAFALLLACARRVVESDRIVRAGGWTAERRWEIGALLGRDLHAATLGILGLGPIGQAVARRAQGFGMSVLGWSRSARELPGVTRVTLDELLARSDFVSVHVALCAETRGLLGAAEFARMKRGAILVNTARGGLVDEEALAEALVVGQLGGAALDVFESEPLARESRLLALPNVVLTPHIGSASVATRTRMVELAVENLLLGLEGRPLRHCVNG